MPKERLLRIAAAYHAFLGAVCALLPGDLFRSLGVEPPRYWTLYYLAVSGPLLAAVLLEIARRRADLRSGLVLAVLLWQLFAMLVLLVTVVWSGLPRVLVGPAVAAGLWAWLLWDVLSPQGGAQAPGAAPAPREAP
jgi:ABC-type Mn2+/Zn2+ transport system permease subunit